MHAREEKERKERISIRAPVKGAMQALAGKEQAFDISIRAPVKGAIG